MSRGMDYNSRMLPVFECPVCTCYMHPPIKQCTQGHSLCENCFEKMNSCPYCRNSLAGARNFSLEELHNQLIFPCKNYLDGCTILCAGNYVKRHERDCHYGLQVCPLNYNMSCDWSGNMNSMLDHLETEHSESTFMCSAEKFCITNFSKSDNNDFFTQKIFFAHNQIFKFQLKICSYTKVMKWAVFYLGIPELCSMFYYAITIESSTTMQMKMKLSAPCEILTKYDRNDNYNQLTTHCDMLQRYCVNDNLGYYVEIIKKFNYAQ